MRKTMQKKWDFPSPVSPFAISYYTVLKQAVKYREVHK